MFWIQIRLGLLIWPIITRNTRSKSTFNARFAPHSIQRSKRCSCEPKLRRFCPISILIKLKCKGRTFILKQTHFQNPGAQFQNLLLLALLSSNLIPVSFESQPESTNLATKFETLALWPLFDFIPNLGLDGNKTYISRSISRRSLD